jgi:excisionase family DNA binding protein
VTTAMPHLNKEAETCEKLRISRSTYFALIKSGQLKSVTIGRRRFVTDRAIAEFVEALEAA